VILIKSKVKKMKKILIFIVFTTIITNAQVTSGILYYKGFIVEDLIKNINEIKDKKLKSVLNDLNNNRQAIDFELYFNKEESLFSSTPKIDVENSLQYKIAVNFLKANSVYYYHLKNNHFIRKTEAYGEDFIINTPNYKWNLSSEIKMIGNYICEKATTTHVIKNSKGTFYHEVIVWYSKQIKVPFGPLGFNGLPGIIVQIEFQNFRYVLSKIDLNPTLPLIIEKPKKGIIVTKEEFDSIGLKNSFKN
jgi:GLPGLI family protein